MEYIEPNPQMQEPAPQDSRAASGTISIEEMRAGLADIFLRDEVTPKEVATFLWNLYSKDIILGKVFKEDEQTIIDLLDDQFMGILLEFPDYSTRSVEIEIEENGEVVTKVVNILNLWNAIRLKLKLLFLRGREGHTTDALTKIHQTIEEKVVTPEKSGWRWRP